MELKFVQSQRRTPDFTGAVLLTAVLGSVFAALDWLALLPAALAGVLIPVCCQIRKPKTSVLFCVLFGLLAIWLTVRFSALADGVKLLINRMYSRSEMQQSYEYDYLQTRGENPWEAVLWLSLLAGTLCALWEHGFPGLLTLGWVGAMAYFGVTPGIGWLTLLGAACLLCAAPERQRWFHGTVIAVLMIAAALVVRAAAPVPNVRLSAWDDRVRDRLALHSVSYEQTVLPTEVPETQPTEPPPEEERQPDHGIENRRLNVLFIVLSAVTAALLFTQAVWKDRAEKHRRENRAGLDDPDNAAAIRAMYLYARRWRELADKPAAVPGEVRAVWLEAAYSEHPMTDAQRQTVHAYMKQTAASVWESAGRKKRLIIRYRIAL